MKLALRTAMNSGKTVNSDCVPQYLGILCVCVARLNTARPERKTPITMTNGYSYYTYNNWNVVPLFVISGIVLLGVVAGP